MNSDQTDQLLSLTPVIHYFSACFTRRMPTSVELDDIRQSAWIGAIQAIKRYRPGGASLKAFSESRIRGAIQDYLRLIDPLSRSQRKAGISRPVLKSLGDGDVVREADCVKGGVDIHRAIERRDIVNKLVANAELTSQEKTVLFIWFYEGGTLKDAGVKLGVTESRASQIASSAIRKLRLVATTVTRRLRSVPQ